MCATPDGDGASADPRQKGKPNRLTGEPGQEGADRRRAYAAVRVQRRWERTDGGGGPAVLQRVALPSVYRVRLRVECVS